MAVPNRGRGLSRAVLQQPDIIGQAQRQQQLRQRDRALDLQERGLDFRMESDRRARRAAASKPFTLGEDDIVDVGVLYAPLGEGVNNAIGSYVYENSADLMRERSMGGGPKTSELNRALAQAKSIAKVLRDFNNSYINDGGSSSASFDIGAYRNYPQSIRQMFGEGEVQIENGNLVIRTSDGTTLSPQDVLALNPQQQYMRPEGLSEFISKGFPSKGLTRENLNDRSLEFATLSLAQSAGGGFRRPQVVADAVEELFIEAGYPSNSIPAEFAQELIEKGSVTAGNRTFTLDDVHRRIANKSANFWERNALRTGNQETKTGNQGKGVEISFEEFVDKTGFAPYSSPRQGPLIEDAFGVTIPQKQRPKIVVRGQKSDGAFIDDEVPVSSIYQAGDELIGVAFSDELNQNYNVPLGENEISQIEASLGLRDKGKTIGDLIDEVNPERNAIQFLIDQQSDGSLTEDMLEAVINDYPGIKNDSRVKQLLQEI